MILVPVPASLLAPDGPAADAAQVITVELIALLVSLRERITAIETGIEQALAAHADAPVFTSLPRSGSVRAATLLAEIGDARGRFPTDEALAAAAGISPSTRASGRARYVVFRRGCNHRLRQAVVDFADGSRQANPLGPGRRPPGPSPRAQPRPRRPGAGPPLVAHHLALLDRPHPLPTQLPSGPHRPAPGPEPAAQRHPRGHAAGLLIRADVVLDSGSRAAARRRCPGWQATRRAPAWTPTRTAAHSPRRERPPPG